MPLHDWTKVDDGIFHDFHSSWIIHLKECLNEGLLPDGFYALAEKHARGRIPDVLTLHVPGAEKTSVAGCPDRGVALVETPPRVGRKLVAETPSPYQTRRRTLTIRHVSDHRIVALLEVISPGNKDRASSVDSFVNINRRSPPIRPRTVETSVRTRFPPGFS